MKDLAYQLSMTSFLFIAIAHRKYGWQKKSGADLLRFWAMTVGLAISYASLWGLFLFMLGALVDDEYIRNVARHKKIYFLGLDGAGKTSHARATVALLRRRGVTASSIHLYRNRIASSLSSIKRIRPVTEPSSKPNPFRSITVFLDCFFVVPLQLLSERLKGNRVTICDRHIYDYYVRLKNLGYPTNPFRWFYLNSLPKQGILLVISLSLAYERRREHPYSYYQVADKDYRFITHIKRYTVINSEAPFKEVQDKIMEVID